MHVSLQETILLRRMYIHMHMHMYIMFFAKHSFLLIIFQAGGFPDQSHGVLKSYFRLLAHFQLGTLLLCIFPMKNPHVAHAQIQPCMLVSKQ